MLVEIKNKEKRNITLKNKDKQQNNDKIERNEDRRGDKEKNYTGSQAQIRYRAQHQRWQGNRTYDTVLEDLVLSLNTYNGEVQIRGGAMGTTYGRGYM